MNHRKRLRLGVVFISWTGPNIEPLLNDINKRVTVRAMRSYSGTMCQKRNAHTYNIPGNVLGKVKECVNKTRSLVLREGKNMFILFPANIHVYDYWLARMYTLTMRCKFSAILFVCLLCHLQFQIKGVNMEMVIQLIIIYY